MSSAFGGPYGGRRIAVTSCATAMTNAASASINKVRSCIMVSSLSPRAGCAMDEEGPGHRTSLLGTGRI